jgi:hypothetical protein
VRIRRFITAVALVVLGWTALSYPLDGLRWAHGLRDGSNICFYHQYRFLPGAHVTPCLEVISAEGKSKSYPIARNTYFGLRVNFRTNTDQSMVWFVEDFPGIKKQRVLCQLNRISGEFVTAVGRLDPDASNSGGFPP